jgi:hypothetical protein
LQEFSFNAAKLKKYLIIRALKSVFFLIKKDGRFGRNGRFGKAGRFERAIKPTFF